MGQVPWKETVTDCKRFIGCILKINTCDGIVKTG